MAQTSKDLLSSGPEQRNSTRHTGASHRHQLRVGVVPQGVTDYYEQREQFSPGSTPLFTDGAGNFTIHTFPGSAIYAAFNTTQRIAKFIGNVANGAKLTGVKAVGDAARWIFWLKANRFGEICCHG